jgi:hypothetical protein
MCFSTKAQSTAPELRECQNIEWRKLGDDSRVAQESKSRPRHTISLLLPPLVQTEVAGSCLKICFLVGGYLLLLFHIYIALTSYLEQFFKMPTESFYPSFEVPDLGLWDFLFERNDREFPDDKGRDWLRGTFGETILSNSSNQSSTSTLTPTDPTHTPKSSNQLRTSAKA